MTFDIAFIGTGPEPDNPVWGESAAMAYRHGKGYRELEQCEFVACADLVRENAEAFADEFGIDPDNVFEDYEEMLAETNPDVVSVATPVPTHARIVLDCIDSGVPDAIHCEKPMADTFGDAKRMADAAAEAGIQLTFNHQRRFSGEYREAKRLVDDGEIGDLQRIEVGGKNLFDFGSHLIDLANSFNGERPAEWVLAGLDYREADVRYGTHNENQAVALWRYGNGVHALASTGTPPGGNGIDGFHTIRGTEGEIRVGRGDDPLRIRRSGDAEWETPEVDDANPLSLAIEHVIDCLEHDKEPVLSAENALRATEIIFGAYEAVRQRGRGELPPAFDDTPLEDLVDRGELTPE